MIAEMAGCCGINVVYCLDFLACDDDYSKELTIEFDEEIADSNADGKAILATIAPEEGEADYKKIRQALIKRGFKELASCPSAQAYGGYRIHLFGLGFKKSKEKRSDHRKRSVVLHRRNTR